jgi:hypothetical protein
VDVIRLTGRRFPRLRPIGERIKMPECPQHEASLRQKSPQFAALNHDSENAEPDRQYFSAAFGGASPRQSEPQSEPAVW